MEISDLNDLHSFQEILYRNVLEIRILLIIFPGGTSQNKGKTRNLQKKPLKGWKLQLIRNLTEAAQANKNLENCRKNKPYIIDLYIITYSNSTGILGNGRIKLGLVPLAR
jgi:hypothetical protein